MTMPGSRRPTFFVVGGSRCGTTSLHAALARHPGIFVPEEKSPNYFTTADLNAVADSAALRAMKGHTIEHEEEYLGLFTGARDGQVIGEVSPVYLQSVFSAGRIRAFAPEASIIAILRHPIERAFAHFVGRRRDGLEPRADFAATIAEELRSPGPKDLAFNNYLAIGRYAHYLAPFLAAFPAERIKLLFFDDLVRDPSALLDDLFRFLGVDPARQQAGLEQRNRGGVIRNPLLRGLWTGTALARARLRRHLPPTLRDRVGRLFLSSMEQPRFPEALLPTLTAYYAEDIATLERLTGRPLDTWRSDHWLRRGRA